MSNGSVFGIYAMMFAILLVVSLPMQIFWIVTLIEVIRIPDLKFRAVGADKTTWVVIVGLVGFVGSIIWWASKRREVKAAPAIPPPPAPGWYPDPEQPLLHRRWWDGRAWTEHQAPGSTTA